MRFPDPPRRTAPEPLLPLINVIFLLLVFLLLVAELAPPDAVPVAPPAAASVALDGAAAPELLIGADGVPRFGAAAGEAALAALAAACGAGCPGVRVRADAAMEAAALAVLLARLPGPAVLVTVPR